MTSLRELYKRSSHYLAGNIGVMVLGFISFPLFTRSVSVAQYGELNIALGLVLVMVIVAKVGLPHSLVRFYAEDGNSADRGVVERYYSTFILTGIGAAACVALLFAAGVSILPGLRLSPTLRYLLLAGAVLIFARALNSLLTGILRAAGRSREFAGVQFAVKVASIATTLALLFLWERSARSLMTSTVLAELATFAVLLSLLYRRKLIRARMFAFAYARTILSFALPFIIFELASAILDSGDRILIKLFLGAEAVGQYSAAYNVSSYLQDLIFASLNQAIIPIYLGIWAAKGKEATAEFLSQSLNNFVLVCCLLCCGTAVCSGDVLVLLASAKYQQAAPLVPLLVIGLVIYTIATFFNAGLYLHKRTGTMAGVVIASAVVNILLNVAFLGRFGLLAAVWATIASFVVLLFATAWFSMPYLRLQIDYRGAAAGMVAAVAAALLVSTLDFQRPVINVLVKGTLSTIIYAGLLVALHTRVRTGVLTMLRRS